MPAFAKQTTSWTTWMPAVAVVALAATWTLYDLPIVVVVLVAALLAGAVASAVHHAEVIAHRVGEPYGSLVLAVAVTVIEVGLIVMLMTSGGGDASTLARDTVFAAVMITLGGILGVSVLFGTRNQQTVSFNAEGSTSALATVATLATLTMVLPSVTTSATGGEFSTQQLVFAAVASIVLWGFFVLTQTAKIREFFLPVGKDGSPITEESHEQVSNRTALVSLGLLVVALVAVVGLAKVLSPSIESAVTSAGLPIGFVGVVIAVMVLAPETIAAINYARADRTQTSFNLAFGSAMASIGLTIPTIAIASIWLSGPLVLGLTTLQIVLLLLAVLLSALTVLPGRATRLEGMVHLAVFAAFVFTAIYP